MRLSVLAILRHVMSYVGFGSGRTTHTSSFHLPMKTDACY